MSEEEKDLINLKISISPEKYIKELLKENKELKKQLEKKYSKIGTLTNEVLYEENTKLINQQKEFINKIKELETKLKENGINE